MVKRYHAKISGNKQEVRNNERRKVYPVIDVNYVINDEKTGKWEKKGLTLLLNKIVIKEGAENIGIQQSLW